MKVIKFFSAILEMLGTLFGLWLFFNEIGGLRNPDFELRTYSIIYVITGLLLIVGCIFHVIDIFSKIKTNILLIICFSYLFLNCLYEILLFSKINGEIQHVIISLLLVVVLLFLDFLNGDFLHK